jgi:5-methylcytosine-specific restriction endonuclease McrA
MVVNYRILGIITRVNCILLKEGQLTEARNVEMDGLVQGEKTILNIQDQFTRRAIWEVYNNKCFYTGAPLEYSDMELDHIIPASYKDKPNHLVRILKDCKLDVTFELNSLYNLVPTNRFNNNRKSDMEFDIGTLMYWLGIVKEKVPAIEKRIESLKKKRNYDEHLSMLKTQLDTEKDEKQRERLLINIVNFISNENDEFMEQEEVNDKEYEKLYKKYKERIGLEAILPTYDNPVTECIIYFNTLKARDCMLVLDNKMVLSQLFEGLFTDPKFGARGFVEYKSKYKNQDLIDLDHVKIRLGNNKIKLSSEDIYVLCEVVDSYAIKYLESINYIEDTLKSYSFSLSKRKNNYKLISLSYNQWRKLIDFTLKHDVDLGNSEWHIFDKNYHYIKVYTNKTHAKYDLGYHAFFYAEYSEEMILYPELASKDLCITFEYIKDLDKRKLENINEKENWNVEIAYNWLVNELLPKVLGRRATKSILNNEQENFFESNIFEKIHYCKNKKITCRKDLYEIISLIQRYFHLNPHKRYRIKREDFIGVYKSIIICLLRSKNVDLFYLCSKLNISQCHSKEELVDSINGLIESIEDTTIKGFGIDYLFRAFLITLQSNKINLLIEDIEYINNGISFFTEVHDREVMLEKYALNFQ